MNLRMNFITFIGIITSMIVNTNSQVRPFYLISHMTNTIDEVDAGLAAGANGVECDVRFSVFGQPYELFHDVPCDCWRHCLSRTPINVFLSQVRNRGTPGHLDYNPRFSLLYMDLKLSLVLPRFRFSAGQQLAQTLVVHFFKPGHNETLTRLILGFPSTRHEEVIQGFLSTMRSSYSHLMKDIGFEISGREDPDYVENMFTNLGLDNIWQGDGLTNCLPSSDSRLRKLLYRRDFEDTNMAKVYSWTVDRTANMRNMLRKSVDGMMTNQVDKLVRVLGEKEFFMKYRIANNRDIPWRKVKGYGPIRASCDEV